MRTLLATRPFGMMQSLQSIVTLPSLQLGDVVCQSCHVGHAELRFAGPVWVGQAVVVHISRSQPVNHHTSYQTIKA